MPDLSALREEYRQRKAELLASVRASGPSTRGVRSALQKLAALADASLRALWGHAGLSAPYALIAVGGFGRGELFPHSDVDVLLLMPDGESPDSNPELKARIEGNPPKLTTWIKGVKFMDYTDTKKRLPDDGGIALQVHGGGDYTKEFVRYRNIKIKIID